MKNIMIFFIVVLLISCESSDSADGIARCNEEDIEYTFVRGTISSEREEVSIVSTYDNVGINLLLDGNTSTSEYWSGNIPGDSFTLDMGKVLSITEIQIYVGTRFFGESNLWDIEISSDGENWLKTFIWSQGREPNAVDCAKLGTDAGGKMFCTFSGGPRARYLRLTLTGEDQDSVVGVEFYELIVSTFEKQPTPEFSNCF